eukprot:EG_transcript_10897
MVSSFLCDHRASYHKIRLYLEHLTNETRLREQAFYGGQLPICGHLLGDDTGLFLYLNASEGFPENGAHSMDFLGQMGHTDGQTDRQKESLEGRGKRCKTGPLAETPSCRVAVGAGGPPCLQESLPSVSPKVIISREVPTTSHTPSSMTFCLSSTLHALRFRRRLIPFHPSIGPSRPKTLALLSSAPTMATATGRLALRASALSVALSSSRGF